MSGEDLVAMISEMLNKHGYSVKEVVAELRKSHSMEVIRGIFERAPILRDFSKEIKPLESDVETSDLLSEQREQFLAERGLVSEQQEAGKIGTRFSVKMALRRELVKSMNVTGKKEG